MARPRSPLGTFRKLVGEAAHPIWMLDGARQVAFVNRAAEQWLGVGEDALLGQRCDYTWTAADIPAEPLHALAVPPEVYVSSTAVQTFVVAPRATGLSRREVTYVPLRDAAGTLTAVWCIAGVSEVPDEARRTMAEQLGQLHRDLGQLRARFGKLYELSQLVGISPAIERVRDQIQVAVTSKVRTLIEGPPGSGREHVARTIYYHQSALGAGVLVPLSCPLLDAELLQSTVAAFIHPQPEFEVEGPVTFLLLDADQLTPDAQTSLMAVLGIVELKAHALTTTARPLLELADQGSFRSDLAHHLSTLHIQLPPLAARREDIPLLAQKMLEDRNAAGGQQWSGFSAEAMDHLVSHAWTGNLNELQDVVQQACGRARGVRVEAADLPEKFFFAQQALAHPRRGPETIVLDQYLERVEAELIRRALRRAKNNRARAARLLGISRPRLLRRIEQLGLS